MKQAFCVFIAGGSGSGKSLAARRIADTLSAPVVCQDSFYRSLDGIGEEALRNWNFDVPDSVEFGLMRELLLELLLTGCCRMPEYSFTRHVRDGGRDVVCRRFIVVEGSMLLAPEAKLADLSDYSVYIDAPADLRLLRRLGRDASSRDLEDTLVGYERFVRPMHLRYVEPCLRMADEVVPNEGKVGEFEARLDGVLKRIQKAAEAKGEAE